MNRAREFVSEDIVDGALAGQPRQARKLAGRYLDMKMAVAAIGRTGMAGMLGALIGNRQRFGRKRLAQLFFNALLNFTRQLHLRLVAA